MSAVPEREPASPRPRPRKKASALRKTMKEGLWDNNPIFRQVLGICSALAVTNLLRAWTPHRIRMMVQTLIIAFYVILVDLALKAYWPEMSRNLGPYVGLIITNCIIMGRCEAFARSNPPGTSFLDGLFSGLGYSFVLLMVAVLRELLGMGSILGIPIPYFSTVWDKWIIMVMPPGAFFTLACLIWIFRSIWSGEEEKSA